MQIHVQLNNGYLPQRYTREATDRYQAQPVESFPMMLQDIPAQTAALAVSLIDYDAVPRTGFPFIHWLAANIPVMTELPADFSRQFTGPQGQTSWMSRFYQLNDPYFAQHYAGPNPPDQPHRYTLTVWALKTHLALANGFYYNDFRDQLAGNVLAQDEIQLLAQ